LKTQIALLGYQTRKFELAKLGNFNELGSGWDL